MRDLELEKDWDLGMQQDGQVPIQEIHLVEIVQTIPLKSKGLEAE